MAQLCTRNRSYDRSGNGQLSLGEADLLRRAMGKEGRGDEQQRARFIDGAVKMGSTQRMRGVPDPYLFCWIRFQQKPLCSLRNDQRQTAYLKAHHRAEFMAALMSVDNNNTDKVFDYIKDCQNAHIKIVPPDVNQLFGYFNVPAKNRKQLYRTFSLKGVVKKPLKPSLKEKRMEAYFHPLWTVWNNWISTGSTKKYLKPIKCGI